MLPLQKDGCLQLTKVLAAYSLNGDYPAEKANYYVWQTALSLPLLPSRALHIAAAV